MDMHTSLAWIESTALSQWIVGDLYAFPVILTLHAIGMGFAAGLSAMLDLRLLGVGKGIPIDELRRFLPVLWAGFWLNAASGILLLIGYPTKALTNPVFYLKLSLIAVAMVLLVRMTRRLFGAMPSWKEEAIDVDRPLRRLALLSLLCWTGAITAGRLLAYTYSYLTASEL
jgi:hypothetical protein